jgi:hypothetical protein
MEKTSQPEDGLDEVRWDILLAFYRTGLSALSERKEVLGHVVQHAPHTRVKGTSQNQ